MNGRDPAIALARGLLGAAAGGALGYIVFNWILSQGFYAMVLPGAAVGFGFSLATSQRSTLNGVICAVLATGLALFTEWRCFPFVKDDSLAYFIAHVYQLKPISLLMIAAGTAVAYWSVAGNSHQERPNPED